MFWGDEEMPDTSCQYVLIVDDSDQVRATLVNSIVAFARQAGKICAVTLCSAEGFKSLAPADEPDIRIGVCDTPSTAVTLLDTLRPPNLTILCDISIPRDTTVGLPGLLERLAQLDLPVNLVFMSSERQNRAIIQTLITAQKAYFVEKGGAGWDALPHAIVHRSANFAYNHIQRADFGGMIRPTPQPEHPQTPSLWQRFLTWLHTAREPKPHREQITLSPVGIRQPTTSAVAPGKHYPFYE